MLTRLEVDGFKNLLGFSAEFGSFTCIAGANAVGKSNVFDVIEFLSLLVEHTPDEAAQRLRGGSEEMDARDLFWRGPGLRRGSMRIAVEMIVPMRVRDALEQFVSDDPDTTRLGYEIFLMYAEPRGSQLVGRVVIKHEMVWAISPRQDREQRNLIFDTYESFVPDSAMTRAQGAEVLASAGGWLERATISSESGLADGFLAVRRELHSWRRLALEPTAMRNPDRFKSPQRLGPDGAHLAATLYRITHQENTEPVDVYAELASRVSELTPVRDIRIDRDDKRENLTLEAQLHHVGWVPARALSEGTLRFLALASLALDPDAPRLVCIEEPENGIHPAAIGPLAELLRRAAHAPERQIIINTHSPVFVRHVHEQAPEDLLMARLVGMPGPEGTSTRALRLKPLADTWRCHDDVRGVGLAALIDYLESPRSEAGEDAP
jgi:predicted ATPase